MLEIVAAGAVIHKLAVTAAVPGWGRPVRKLMNNRETDISFRGTEAVSEQPSENVAASLAFFLLRSRRFFCYAQACGGRSANTTREFDEGVPPLSGAHRFRL